MCDCGNSKRIKGADLRNGKVTSCGCWKNEKTSARFHKHGDSKSNLYEVWQSMKARCYRRRNNRYIEYNGETYTLSQLSKIAVVSYTTLRTRLNLGWSVDDAVTIPDGVQL
jgi:hypothetical protein